VQLVTQFLSEALDLKRTGPLPDCLTENFDPDLFNSGALSFYFERLDETLRLTNANLLIYHYLSMLCKHFSFDLEMLLWPARHAPEWRALLSLMVDFALFREAYEPRHLALVRDFNESQLRLQTLTGTLAEGIERKCALERRRGEMLGEEAALRFGVEESRAGAETAEEAVQVQEGRNGSLKDEEEALLAELEEMEVERDGKRTVLEEARSLIVSSPERVSRDREEAAEMVRIMQEQLDSRMKVLQTL
jgi:hypothetical protein